MKNQPAKLVDLRECPACHDRHEVTARIGGVPVLSCPEMGPEFALYLMGDVLVQGAFTLKEHAAAPKGKRS